MSVGTTDERDATPSAASATDAASAPVATPDPPGGAARRGPAATEGAAGAAGAEPRWAPRLALVSVLAAILPIVVATVRAVVNDWRPIGDNAYFALRSRDVLTEHHPLLGSWTSASQTLGVDMNNPGPLYFDALALPAKLGGDAGLAVGVALLNVAAVVGLALVARRVAGSRGVIVAMLAATGLGWAMGSELLFDPWQPHSLMLPFLCFLVMTWALATGDLVMLPWLAGLASYILQTHVGYALILPTLAGGAVGVAGLRLWRSRAEGSDRSTADWRRARRYLAITGVVLVVAWSQPLYEQFFGPGRGNLSRLASSLGADQERVGPRLAARLVAQVVALPPWWGRPSMSDSFATFFADTDLSSTSAAVAGLLAVTGLLAGALILARRRHDRPAATATATGLAVLAVTLIAVATMPVANYGLAAHHMRWLWPIALFLTLVLALGWLTRPGQPGQPGTAGFREVGVVGVAGVTLVLSALSLPSMNPRTGPSADEGAMPVVGELLPQLEALRDERGVLFDISELRFAEPYSWPLLSELQRLGVRWYVDDPGMVRQVGPSRQGPDDATVRLHLREGGAAHEVPTGAARVAIADGLDGADDAELARLRRQLASFVADGGLRLTAAASRLEPAPATAAQLGDPDHLLAIGTDVTFERALVRLVEEDLLDVPERWARRLERYAALQQRADRSTVAVVAEPL